MLSKALTLSCGFKQRREIVPAAYCFTDLCLNRINCLVFHIYSFVLLYLFFLSFSVFLTQFIYTQTLKLARLVLLLFNFYISLLLLGLYSTKIQTFFIQVKDFVAVPGIETYPPYISLQSSATTLMWAVQWWVKGQSSVSHASHASQNVIYSQVDFNC